MSDVVLVALISAVTSIIVAFIPQIFSLRNKSTATDGESISKLKGEIGALRKENKEKQEIIDYYRKKDELK
ncbi:hypothetical protein LFAB_05315 [Lactiplantibacillus fabifermentans T30PCM01]|uniref:Uncharacterized protein n=1 Tax=Lactiplantibacillus fabifermentans T30PCM01 TaxID=1400520 RepID=W6T8M1_9LACO|nr:hypothetical protein [Lactiplantibacillus fabifermentans]ETY74781.1 hypothetical protein LFAB_05315 [Lactiplantibacillus fabifermentans T30PCM01]